MKRLTRELATSSVGNALRRRSDRRGKRNETRMTGRRKGKLAAALFTNIQKFIWHAVCKGRLGRTVSVVSGQKSFLGWID